MSNYSKTTNFLAKDALISGDPLKVVKGSEHDTEYTNIATAITSKADSSGTAITSGSINGTTIGNSTPSTGAFTTLSATGLITASAGETIASGQTLTLTGATVAGAPTWGSTQTLNTSGNAATVTTNANLTGPITSTGNATAIASGNTYATPTLSGTVTMTTAVSKLVPGATSFSCRNNADSADNILISDAGNVTVRGTLTGAGSMLSPITNSLGANVSLNNTANYFDGPSVAQGTSGTWSVSGSVTVTDASAAAYSVKLWDGTTVISSGQVEAAPAERQVISLSGFITSPAGNLRISVKDGTTTGGLILFNASGNSKDSTITAIRIA